MAKKCLKHKCSNPRWGKGYCKYHQYYREDYKEPKKRKVLSIKPISDKMRNMYAEYRPIRDEYMFNHEICEFKECSRLSNDLHHKAGRGKFMSDDTTFMALCRKHHNWVHEHPKESRELGYLV